MIHHTKIVLFNKEHGVFVIPLIVVFVLLSMIVVGCDDDDADELQPSETPELSYEIEYGECKVFKHYDVSADSSLDCLEYRYENETLYIKHINAGFNCCPGEIVATISLEGDTLLIEEAETEPIRIFPDGRILAAPTSSQAHRYQVARFSKWVDLSEKGYSYRITPAALQEAKRQDLNVPQIIAIFEAANQDKLHPSLLRAITRWAEAGREAYIEMTLVLRVKNSGVMEQIQSEQSISRYLQEVLGPTTVMVKEKDLDKIVSAASRLGILIDLP